MAVAQYEFGSGILYGRSNQSNNPTPVRFGALQDVSIDFSFTSKPLYGSNQYPIAVGRGTAKITGKAKWAQMNAQAYNDLFFGNSSLPTGQTKTQVSEAATGANSVAVTNAANFVSDLGVIRATDGAIYQRVANNPIGLQYACNESNGGYTFNSSQNGVGLAISYTYNDSANGFKINITNQQLGNATYFTAVFTNTYNGQQQTLVLNSCMSNKLTFATKLEDWTIPEFDFDGFADGAGNIGTLSFSN